MNPTDDALFAEIRRDLFTAAIGDILDELGFRNQFLPPTIRPLRADMVLVGRAMPVAEIDIDEEPDPSEPFELMLRALDDLKANEVYIAAGASPTYALWGELMTAAAVARGSVGVVCDGYVRDTPGILAQDFPTFAHGSYAQDQKGRGKVTDFRCAIQIGETRIQPGDLIVGDIDGVVVTPAEAEEETLRRAFDKARREKTVMRDIRTGMSTQEVFRKHGIL